MTTPPKVKVRPLAMGLLASVAEQHITITGSSHTFWAFLQTVEGGREFGQKYTHREKQTYSSASIVLYSAT